MLKYSISHNNYDTLVFIFKIFPFDVTIQVQKTSQKNPFYHLRTKHIEVRHHFIRDHVKKGNITLEFVP